MPYRLEAVRSRIETLRQWKWEKDPDAQIMTDMLEEIERLSARDARQSANPEHV